MLGSLTPLGERSRGNRWLATLAWFSAASSLTGALIGAAVGGAGRIVAPAPSVAALVILAVGTAAGVCLDLGLFQIPLPTPRRQVNDAWLHSYRGWVYGAGFGAQLGAGYATVINSSALYIATAAAFLSRDAWHGAVILGAYGSARALSVLPAGTVNEPKALAALLRRGDALRGTVFKAATGAQTIIAGGFLAAAFIS
jgi:hypothetical protein